MNIAFIGNFQPTMAPEDRHSTENHILEALTALGHHVDPIQEDVPDNWRMLSQFPRYAVPYSSVFPDLFLWTRTGWSWELLGTTEAEMHACMTSFLARCREQGIPTVGVHLDRWWGLARQNDVYTQPYFKVDHLFTADGGHNAEWKAAGVNHHWMPPAVSEFECVPGTARAEYQSDVAFIGSWQGYHPEWLHRFELVEHLRQRGDCRFWPEPGQVVRGVKLRDVIASTKVIVGDSCLVGGITHYCSDRIPETLGRGGFLVHPHVEGVTDGTLYNGSDVPLSDGPLHLDTWLLNDWRGLDDCIEAALIADEVRRNIARYGREHVLANHTYTVRMREVLEAVKLA